jgi:hypothetical protein
MSRPDAKVADFWFQKGLHDAPMLCGPDIAVLLAQGASGLVHGLRIGSRASPPARIALKHAIIAADSLPESDDKQLDERRIENPVYQEFVPHELTSGPGEGIGALLTGSCFDHHFSAVFSLGRDRDEPECIVLEIDVADRCRGPIERLAATYIITGKFQDVTSEPVRATARSVTWDLDGGVLELEALAPAIIEEPSSSGDGVKVQILARIDPQTYTQRLHYRWRWASCADRTRLTA